jgi:hypothetical protein
MAGLTKARGSTRQERRRRTAIWLGHFFEQVAGEEGGNLASACSSSLSACGRHLHQQSC